MRTLFITLVLSLLPIISYSNNNGGIVGETVIASGETTVLSAYPYDPSYKYVWEFDMDADKLDRQYSYTITGNTITITHLGKSQSSLLDVYCTIYDNAGAIIGFYDAEVVVQPRL